jgi:hypothetical protein
MRYRPTRAEPERFAESSPTPALTHEPCALTPSPSYAPTIAFHAQGAHQGVRRRLFGAAASGLVAAVAAASLLIFSFQTYALLMVCVIAGACALVTITLAMSARKEEEVHDLAASLSRQLPDEKPALEDASSTDGTV